MTRKNYNTTNRLKPNGFQSDTLYDAGRLRKHLQTTLSAETPKTGWIKKISTATNHSAGKNWSKCRGVWRGAPRSARTIKRTKAPIWIAAGPVAVLNDLIMRITIGRAKTEAGLDILTRSYDTTGWHCGDELLATFMSPEAVDELSKRGRGADERNCPLRGGGGEASLSNFYTLPVFMGRGS